MRASWLLAIPAAVLAVFVAWPLWTVLRFADAAAWQWATQSYVRHTLVVAAQQAAASVGLTFAIALPLAWLHHRWAIRGGRLLLAAHALPFVMPVFVIVYGLQLTGIVRGLTPFAAVVVAHAYYNYGFAAQLTHSALASRPRRLEEAAATLGAGPLARHLRVTLPLLAPALGATALLVFLFTFASFGTVLYLGAESVRTLETVLFAEFGGNPNASHAAVLGLLELGCNAVLLLAYLAVRRRVARVPAATPPTPPKSAVATTVGWGLAALAITPAATVLVAGFRLGGQWSLAPWQALLAGPSGFDLATSLGYTLLYAVGSAALALGLVACVLYGSRRLPAGARRAIEALAAIPLAASSLLVGFGFLETFNTRSWLPLVATPWIVLAAHTILVLPFAARTLVPAFEARDIRLEQAAASLGARPAAVAWRVHLPLLLPSLTAAVALGMAMSFGDFGASRLLATHKDAGIAVWVADLDGPFLPILHARAVALAGLLGALSAAAFLLVERVRWKVA